jgi:hypothetical protein
MTDWNRCYRNYRQQKRAESNVLGAYFSAALLNDQRNDRRVLQRGICCAGGGCRNGNRVGLRRPSGGTPRAASGQHKNRGASEKYKEDGEECARHLGKI